MALLLRSSDQFHDANGNPLSAGTVTFYDTNTTTAKAIYSDAALTTALSNPITLTAGGKSATNVYCADGERYTVVVTDSVGAQVDSPNDVWGAIEDFPTVGFTSTYTPSFTGAVGRTLQTRLEDARSVLDFGVSQGTTTDQTAAVQAAITSMSTGGTLVFPAGTYRIDDPVSIANDDITLLGYGATIFGATGQTAGGTNDQAIWFIEANNVQIHGFTAELQVRVPFIQVRPPDTNDLEHFYFSDMNVKDAFYAIRCSRSDDETQRTKSVHINNVTSEATAALNAGHFLMIGVDYVNITNCHTIRGQNASCYGFAEGCTNITVTGCTARDNQDASTSDASLQIENNPNCRATITGNVFDHDIWVDECSEVTIGPNYARRLRFTVTTTSNTNITCTGGNYTGITLDDIGTVTGSPATSADFIGMVLDPLRNSGQGSGIFLNAALVADVKLSDIRFVSNAPTANLSLVRNASQTILYDSIDFNGGTVSISGSAVGTMLARNCVGITSRNRGTSTVTSGNTSVVVSHGLLSDTIGAPSAGEIHITPTNDPTNTVDHWWVDTITNDEFTLNVSADPGATGFTFGWEASRERV